MTVLYILLAIFIFGLIIAMHELGHFLVARLFKVTVREFSIGMGPKIFSVKSKKSEVVYSLRLLPLGGYCDMGEDLSDDGVLLKNGEKSTESKEEKSGNSAESAANAEASPSDGGNEYLYKVADDPNHFSKKPVWQRILILIAGSLTNIIAGFIVMFIIVLSVPQQYSNKVLDFVDNASSYKTGLRVGDEIVSVAGHRTHIANDVVYRILMDCAEPAEIVVIRDGERIVLENVTFGTTVEDDIVMGVRDFNFEEAEGGIGTVLKQTLYQSKITVDMVFDSIKGLITGRFGFKNLSGPVGVTSALTSAAKYGFGEVVYLFVVIAINIGVVNLLPIPALDGGRVVFRLIELFTKKRIKPEIEGYIHLGGMVLLLLLMVAVTIKDVIFLF